MEAVDQLTLDDFTSSSRLREVLLELLHQKSRHVPIKTESFLRLAIPLLNVSIVGRLLHSEQKLKEFLKTIIVFYNTNFEVSDCVEFILKVIDFEITSLPQWSHHMLGSIHILYENIITSFESITMILLNVKTISNELKTIIQNVKNNIELHLEDKKFQTQSIFKYFTWVKTHQDDLCKACQAAEIIESLDRNFRAWMKGEIYENPVQIIRIYNMKYKSFLQNIHLPSLSYIYHDTHQAIKDVSREHILINDIIIEQYADYEAHLHDYLWNLFESNKSNPVSNGLEFDEETSQESQAVKSEYSNIHFQVFADFIYSHILVASSRTIISGDVYHIIEDLYGDESLVLCPGHQEEPKIKLHLSKDLITIEMSEVFELHPRSAVEYCVISFFTKTVTSIRLNLLFSIYQKTLSDMEDNETFSGQDNLENQYILEDILKQEETLCGRRVAIAPFINRKGRDN